MTVPRPMNRQALTAAVLAWPPVFRDLYKEVIEYARELELEATGTSEPMVAATLAHDRVVQVMTTIKQRKSKAAKAIKLEDLGLPADYCDH